MSEEITHPEHTEFKNALAENGSADEEESLQARIVEELRSIYDPEIPVPIYDLGLIYEVEITEDRAVHVEMTLTAPNCPAAETLPREVEQKIRALPDVTEADVEIVFEPPFTPDMMTDEARMQLGMM